MPLLYHAYVYLEFLILACTIYILASVQPADVHEESRFMEDLGFTSFDFMSMLGEIEDTFDVEIEQTKAAEIRTVQEAVDYLETLKDA